ncbi:MAG TPA: NAD-dependent epimerase/dehydratase family protein [Longilinea sp.]|nr:NAD-dependent epimerase/dehydratase family protein [Longilinea sp.]
MGTYLVTGAAGFIASKVCEDLLANEQRVVGVDNLNDAYDVRMKQWRLSRLTSNKAFSFYHRDIGDRLALDEIASNHGAFDAVINLAARAGVRFSVENPWAFFDANLTGTLNLLELCRHRGIPKFVLASSSSVYGANAPLPTPEEADTDHPIQPYAASKKSAEALSYAYHYLYGTDVTVFRFFNVYGPGNRPDMAMFHFIRWINENMPIKLNGDGTQSRGFTYLDDIARGTIAGLRPLGYEIINLGGHETVSMNELIARLEAIIGKKAQIDHMPANKADMQANWANVDKARRLLGWEPQVNLEEGLRLTVEWYLKERSWASQIES